MPFGGQLVSRCGDPCVSLGGKRQESGSRVGLVACQRGSVDAHQRAELVNDSVKDLFGRPLKRIQLRQLADEGIKETLIYSGQYKVMGNEFEPLSDELSPERVLIGRQAMDAVSAVLLDLPPRTAEAFFLNRFEAMTYEAVARRMGISVKAVEQLIQRALRRLAERLEAMS